MGWACGYQADLQNSYKWCSFRNRLTLHWGHHFHQGRKSVSFHVPQEVHCTCAPHGSIPGPVHKMSVSVELYGQLLQLDLNQHPKQRCDNIKMIGIVQSIIKLVITWFKENKIIISGFLHKTTAEIPYWWHITTQIWEMHLISHANKEIFFSQSKALPRSR